MSSTALTLCGTVEPELTPTHKKFLLRFAMNPETTSCLSNDEANVLYVLHNDKLKGFLLMVRNTCIDNPNFFKGVHPTNDTETCEYLMQHMDMYNTFVKMQTNIESKLNDAKLKEQIAALDDTRAKLARQLTEPDEENDKKRHKSTILPFSPESLRNAWDVTFQPERIAPFDFLPSASRCKANCSTTGQRCKKPVATGIGYKSRCEIHGGSN
jgi:hypothetical protein